MGIYIFLISFCTKKKRESSNARVRAHVHTHTHISGQASSGRRPNLKPVIRGSTRIFYRRRGQRRRVSPRRSSSTRHVRVYPTRRDKRKRSVKNYTERAGCVSRNSDILSWRRIFPSLSLSFRKSFSGKILTTGN